MCIEQTYETCSHKIPSYDQIHIVQTLSLKTDILNVRVAALFGAQNPLFPGGIPLFSIDF